MMGTCTQDDFRASVPQDLPHFHVPDNCNAQVFIRVVVLSIIICVDDLAMEYGSSSKHVQAKSSEQKTNPQDWKRTFC